jgi:hypothetical protein
MYVSLPGKLVHLVKDGWMQGREEAENCTDFTWPNPGDRLEYYPHLTSPTTALYIYICRVVL